MTYVPVTTPAGVNIALNPSFEYGTFGIVSNAISGVTTSFRDRIAEGVSWSGDYAFKSTIATANTSGFVYLNWGETTATNPPVLPGQHWAAAFRYFSTHPDLSARIYCDICNAAYSNIGSLQGPATVYGNDESNGWQTVIWPDILMPAGAAYLRVQIRIEMRSTSVVGESVYLDGMHIAPAEIGVRDYIDGDQGPAFGWTGTPGQSSSFRNPVATVGPTGVGGQIAYRARYYATDINNNFGDDISGQIITGNVDYDIDRAGMATCKLTALDAASVPKWGWIAAFVETTQEDGTFDSNQVGLFQLGQPQVTGDEASATVATSGADICTVLQRAVFLDTYNIAIGTNVQTAIQGLITYAGVTRHAIPATSRVTGKIRSYKPGDSVWAALVDLTTAVGWYAVYPTFDGRVTTKVYRGLDKTTPSRTYTLGQRSALIGPIVTDASDSGFANVIVAIRDDPTNGTLTSTARNDDPRSPASTTYPNGPGVVARVVTVNTIADQAALDKTAQQYLASATTLASGTLVTLPDPTLDVHDVIQIVADPVLYPHLAEANGAWFAQQISYGLTASSASMTLKVRRSEVNG